MKFHRWLRIALGLIAALALGFSVFLATIDSHHTNAKYLLWKHHLWPYKRDLALRYLSVDLEFRRSLVGKTRAELQAWYPVLNLPKPDDPYIAHDGDAYDGAMKSPRFVWIDGTHWGVTFNDGKVKAVRAFKG